MTTKGDNLHRLRKTSNRFSMANLPSIMTKSNSSKHPYEAKTKSQNNTPAINSNPTFANEENMSYSPQSTSLNTSLKSHNSNASSQMGGNGKQHNKLARKQPGSKWGSQSKNSISNMSFGGDSITSSDGLVGGESPVDGEFDASKEGGRIPHAMQNIMYHGEVQTAVGMFRKKMEYVVLTDKMLCRFPDITKACETYPKIKSRRHSSTQRREARSASIGSAKSWADLKSLRSDSSSHEADKKNEISLCKVVATYRVDDGRPFFITEVVYWDDYNSIPGSMQLMCVDPREADLWHTSIRAACQKAKLVSGLMLPERVINYCAGILESAMDYDARSMKIFRAVRRPQAKSDRPIKPVSGKASMEDLKQPTSSVCYLVFGINKLHIVQPDSPEKQDKAAKKQAMPNDLKAKKTSFGYVNMVSMEIMDCDDVIEVGFRLPMQQEVVVSLASCQAPDIGTLLFRSFLYLKPQWLEYTFVYAGPREVLDDSEVDLGFQEEIGCFDRTLVAYCCAYGCTATNIRYTVVDDADDEDGPRFLLLPNAEGRPYSLHELLAIFRSLRYNECFHTISFANISLQALYSVVDNWGTDHIATTDRTRVPIQEFFGGLNPVGKSLLYQEVQALALKTLQTRKLDFSNTLPQRRVKDTWEEDVTSRDPGCEIAAAFMPIRRAGLTQIDWIVLNGIELGETDMEDIAPALHERQSNFRAVEVAKCALNDRLLGLFLKKLERQNSTLQCINIADNPGRLKLADFPTTMSVFTKIRKLNLSRATGTASDMPLINEAVLLTWRLEELVLTGVPVSLL